MCVEKSDVLHLLCWSVFFFRLIRAQCTKIFGKIIQYLLVSHWGQSLPIISVLDLTWLMPCRSQWNISHRPLFSIQFCIELHHPLLQWTPTNPEPPSSSSCTWILLFPFLTPGIFKYSMVALFFCGLVVSTANLVWQCCHYFFAVSLQSNSISFL